MKSECCHQHPDNGDLATQDPAQREETDLRAINDQLLAALEPFVKATQGVLNEGGNAHREIAHVRLGDIRRARIAIEATK